MIVRARSTTLAYFMLSTGNIDYDSHFELMSSTCHTEDDGPLEEELIKRASYSHLWFKEDNANIFYKLEESTRLKACSTYINPFQSNEHGRNSWLSTVEQHAGVY